ncbi:MAG: PrsW family intramembrane metalloprotease [Bacteroidota bacterium]|nr:PrsW family intramembrane metalloprotease [Bacteroidota bacterium]
MALALLSLVFAVIPMLAYLWVVWILDRYDREPLGLLALNFFWGAFGAVILAVLASLAASAALAGGDWVETVVIAPLVEEPAKGLALFLTARSRHFDNITDGIVYGMAVGLGFGMTENFLYYLTVSDVREWVLLVVLRTLFSASVHAMATGVFGAFIGWAKFQGKRARVPIVALGFTLAIGLHAFWNYSVSLREPSAFLSGVVFIVFSVVVVFAAMQVSLRFEHRLLLRELTEEARFGLIPVLHLQFLPFSSRRTIRGWLDPMVDAREYVRAATRLAFRKSQVRHVDEKLRGSYEAEIESLRTCIRRLLTAVVEPQNSCCP